jgi:hypothetical protein
MHARHRRHAEVRASRPAVPPGPMPRGAPLALVRLCSAVLRICLLETRYVSCVFPGRRGHSVSARCRLAAEFGSQLRSQGGSRPLRPRPVVPPHRPAAHGSRRFDGERRRFGPAVPCGPETPATCCGEFALGRRQIGVECRIGVQAGDDTRGDDAARRHVTLPVRAADDAALAEGVAARQNRVCALRRELGEDQRPRPADRGMAGRIRGVLRRQVLALGNAGRPSWIPGMAGDAGSGPSPRTSPARRPRGCGASTRRGAVSFRGNRSVECTRERVRSFRKRKVRVVRGQGPAWGVAECARDTIGLGVGGHGCRARHGRRRQQGQAVGPRVIRQVPGQDSGFDLGYGRRSRRSRDAGATRHDREVRQDQLDARMRSTSHGHPDLFTWPRSTVHGTAGLLARSGPLSRESRPPTWMSTRSPASLTVRRNPITGRSPLPGSRTRSDVAQTPRAT